MTVAQPMLTPAQHHGNRQLFSDHYLDNILPGRGDWQMLGPAAAVARGRIAAILADYQPSTNEAQTEHELVRPILEVLGHTFEVQAPLKTPDGTRKPDYVLYCDAAARTANKNQVLDDARLADRAFAVGEAKYWERPLDIALQAAGGDPFNNRNPSYQIAFYMQHAGTPWGLLTNGRRWRLYQRDTAHKLDRFYEVDLPGLTGPDATDDAFLYFYGFFRRAAFDPGPLSLDALLRESIDYARNVGEGLKAQVYEALRHLAQGFLDYGPNELAVDLASLKTIYDHSLIVLYRLLFVFYAEARDLLPLSDSQQYRDSYSLRAMTHDIANALTAGRRLLSTSARLWPQLRELFGIINAGSPPLKVATFNGGLFDPSRYPFLERYIVGDAHLQAALDRLARVNGQFIDYRDLSERHLGTIYEGLLEHHLAGIAPEDGWTVDLFNDRGERKRTGSYYTPDAIVKYIVEQTVGPALAEAVTGIKDAQKQVDAVLNINCLDPAMGSGHFLVEVVEHIARFLVDLGAPVEDARSKKVERPSSDLAHWKRRVAQSCVYGVDVNPLAVDLAKLSLWLSTAAKDRPLSFLDHHLRAGNSLVGARLVDLGSAAPGGEGSVAATLGEGQKRERRAAKAAQAAQAAGQTSMLEDDAFRQSLSQAVDFMWLIEGNAGETVAQVKEQEQIYATLRETLARRYGRLADLATARRFGLRVDAGIEPRLAEYAIGRSVARFPQFDALLGEAAALAERHRFFHWELEFPEVFFDKRGYALGEKAGFDVVVGNPPYVRQEQVSALKPYLAQAHADVYDGSADLYVYFYRQGLEMLRLGGRLSYIVTNKWLRAGYGEALRGYFSRAGRVEQIVDFGHAPIFPEADTFPCIIVVCKDAPGPEHRTAVCLFPREEWGRSELTPYVRRNFYVVPSKRFTNAPWSLERGEVEALMAKMRNQATPLTDYLGTKIYYGIKTGLNEAFLIDTPTRNRLIAHDTQAAAVISPYLRGQDIKRWSPDWAGLWMILLKSSENQAWPWSEAGENAEDVFATAYPALYGHLKPLEDRLRARQDKGRFWWELRSCAYYDIFTQPKIVHTDITWQPQFAFVQKPMCLLNTAYVWPSSDPYLLAVVNSPVLWSYMWRNAVHGKDEALRLIYSFTETLPIAQPTDELRARIEPAVTDLIAATGRRRQTREQVLEWLRVEFAVESPGNRLAAVETLDEADFVAEIRSRRPRSAPRITPAALHDLKVAYGEYATPLRALAARMAETERRVAGWVNEAYGLTAEEVALLWKTAPPRMPAGQ